jgi:hypothetical protein
MTTWHWLELLELLGWLSLPIVAAMTVAWVVDR